MPEPDVKWRRTVSYSQFFDLSKEGECQVGFSVTGPADFKVAGEEKEEQICDYRAEDEEGKGHALIESDLKRDKRSQGRKALAKKRLTFDDEVEDQKVSDSKTNSKGARSSKGGNDNHENVQFAGKKGREKKMVANKRDTSDDCKVSIKKSVRRLSPTKVQADVIKDEGVAMGVENDRDAVIANLKIELSKYKDQEDTIKVLQLELKRMRDQQDTIVDLNRELANLRDQHQQSQQQVQAYQSSYIQLESKYKALKGEWMDVIKLKDELETLRGELVKERKSREGLENRISRSMELNEALETQLATEKNDKDRIRSEREMIRSECKSLEDQLNKSKAEVNQLKNDLELMLSFSGKFKDENNPVIVRNEVPSFDRSQPRNEQKRVAVDAGCTPACNLGPFSDFFHIKSLKSNKWSCTATNCETRKEIEFSLEFFYDPAKATEMVEFVPLNFTECGRGADPSDLPDYLSTVIYFCRSSIAQFLVRLLNYLYK